MISAFDLTFYFVIVTGNEQFSIKTEEYGRPLYFDAQATTPMV